MSTYRWLFPLSLAVFTAGCAQVVSVQPLATDETTTFDSALIGTWTDGEDILVVVRPGNGQSYNLTWTEKNDPPVRAVAVLTRVANENLLDVTASGDTPALTIPVHMIANLKIHGDEIELRQLRAGWFDKNVQPGGPPAYGKRDTQIVLTAPTADLRTFFARPSLTETAYEEPLLLRRMRP